MKTTDEIVEEFALNIDLSNKDTAYWSNWLRTTLEEVRREERLMELEILAVHLDRQLSGYTSVDLSSIYRYIKQRGQALTPTKTDKQST